MRRRAFVSEAQGELFDLGVQEEREEQRENLERVSSRIEPFIIDFCKSHPQFHADQLRKYVAREVGPTAPASADRILRYLRQRKKLDYVVTNRRQSEYEVLWIKGKEEK